MIRLAIGRFPDDLQPPRILIKLSLLLLVIYVQTTLQVQNGSYGITVLYENFMSKLKHSIVQFSQFQQVWSEQARKTRTKCPST